MNVSQVTANLPESYKPNVRSYLNTYDSYELRREAALRLAANDPDLDGDAIHPTRNILLAQWGDTDEQIIETAGLLYPLREQLKPYVGQSIVAFRQGASETIDPETKTHKLSTPLVIETGTINSSNPYFGFMGNVSEKGSRRMGVKPPYLGFAIGVTVVNHQRVEMDPISPPTIIGGEPTESHLFLYIGTSTLVDDLDAYQAARKNTRRYRATLGNELAVSAVRAIAELAPLETMDAFFSARRQGLITSDQPLPDLNTVFEASCQPAVAEN